MLQTFSIPNIGGKQISKFFNLTDRDLLILIPALILSWIIYSKLFIPMFNFNARFLPTFILGFITALLVVKYRKNVVEVKMSTKQ